jgi:N-acetylmuramoyl-L-alanine amidase
MTSCQRRLGWGVLPLAVALLAVPGYARARHGEPWAREHYAAAERMREALNGRPPADRARRDYQRVINAYRNVYFGAPTSSKADPSVVAVAETMVEMGHRFEDDKILNGAIAQYKFLRREYPGSKFRCDALFTIGEIYREDLDDPDQAREVFQEFLDRYPHNRLVEDAQRAVAELDRQSLERQAEAEKKAGTQKKSAKGIAKSLGAKDSPVEDAEVHSVEPTHIAPASQPSRASRVTGIRHWSTPDYTRVAIDLENEIKFGSQRIANPDRIFFDLRNTKLASTLVGKTFDVDDGFLKKIRVAQFQPGRSRVVLEVDDLSTYEAFLLPNPYRLIIDIHGKRDAAKTARTKRPDGQGTAVADVEAPPKAGRKSDSEVSDVNEAAAQTKDDLRAEAGKAPVTSQDVSDVAKIEPKPAFAKKAAAGPTKRVDVSREMPAPTKVVVDNDDDSSDNAAASTRAREKSSTRLASSRKVRDLEIREAKPTAGGDRSLIRALGLKIGKIVIDPGHGGHDTGTIGPNGLEEKDLVLEVGRKLGKLLETRLGAEVVYTRKDDTFIPLETRTAIANQQRADLFISIHANSSRDSAARGVETYYLNFTSSPQALEVAARENAVSEKSIYELQDLVKKIAMKEKIEESREFAGDVQSSLHSGLAAKSPAIRNRGVKKAPFIVLIGANMPSILAEVSFVSNPSDEHRLETSEYRQRIAESLYRGIAKYVDGLSGVKVASKLDKAAVQ